MKTKSFFADRIHDALAAAHSQLGPDAVLLASHRTPPESLHLGAFEVVCGCRETTDPAPEGKVQAPRNQAASAPARDLSLIHISPSMPCLESRCPLMLT